MIEINNVTKKIKKKEVLKQINCSFKPGEVVVIRGHNGSGKTMLLRLCCGLIKPTEGLVSIPNNARFGVVIEQPSFLENETAINNLEFLASINGIISNKEIEDTLRELNLYQFRHDKVKTYSLGMKQRLALCQALMENQNILLLDEPFNGLDDKNLKIVANLLNQAKHEGKIVVVAAHGDVPLLEVDRVIKMSDGHIMNI